MKRVFTKLIILVLICSSIIAVGGSIFPKIVIAETFTQCVARESKKNNPRVENCYTLKDAPKDAAQLKGSDSSGWWLDSVFKPLFGWLSNTILSFVSLLTGIAGIFLNGVIYHTVVNVAENYDKIKSIDVAWRTVRDVANMGFIFILLYAAIMTIIGQGSDNQKLIVKVVVMAILINFSMFFTRVIIDMSNLMALTFYEAIVPGAAAEGFKFLQTGLSQAFTQHLYLTSIFSSSTNGATLSIGGIITTGIMGSILLLIAAFVFFAVAIMFVIRYVVLIIVIILSPIAFMAMILPQLKPQADKWWAALTGQAVFAPVYFMLTWVTLKVLEGIMGPGNAVFGEADKFSGIRNAGASAGTNSVAGISDGIVATFINFSVVIAFLIISLVLAKEWASKGPTMLSSMNKWATGKAGALTLGAAGWAGRNTIGRGMQAIGESEYLKNKRSSMIAKGGLYGAIGGMGIKATQAAAKKGGSSSFDMRGTGLKDTLGVGSAPKGGYEAQRKDASKKAEEYAKSQEPSDKAKARAKMEYDVAEKRYGAASPEAKAARIRRDILLGNKDDIEKRTASAEENKKKEIEKVKNSEELRAAELAERSAQDTVSRLEAEAKVAVGTADADRRKAEVDAAKVNLKNAQEVAKEIRRKNKEDIDFISEAYEKTKTAIKSEEIKSAGERRKDKEADAIETSVWARAMGYNHTAAAQIRKGKKSAKELIDEALKATGEKNDGDDTSKPPAAPTPPPPPATP